MPVELRRPKPPLEFKWKVGSDEVVFLVKPESSEEDRMRVAFTPMGGARCREMVRLMVVGWRGVARDKVDVPYAYEELEHFPRAEGHNLFLDLGRFILEHSDISKEGKEVRALKND
jgi:hypothetical protein